MPLLNKATCKKKYIINTWQKSWGIPFEKRCSGRLYLYLDTHTFLYWRKKNLLINSSFIILVFDYTFVLFIHWLCSHGQPAEFHVCITSLHGISLLGFQNCISVLFLPIYLNNIREKFLKKTKVCSLLMEVYFSNWRQKNSGLGEVVWMKCLICGRNGIAIKKDY